MGLASSQARLLSLTSRQHAVEHQAQLIMNNKMALANDSDDAYSKYLHVLNSTSLKTYQTDSNGGEGWIAGNIYNLLRYQTAEDTSGTVFYTQDINTGKLYIPKSLGDVYNTATSARDFAIKMGVTYEEIDTTIRNTNDINNYELAKSKGWDKIMTSNDYNDYLEAVTNNNVSQYLNDKGLTETKIENYKKWLEYNQAYNSYIPSVEYIPGNDKMAKYYEEMFKAIEAAGGWIEVSDTLGKNYTWVNNMIKNAQVCLATWDVNNEMLSRTSSALNINLKEVTDNSELEKSSQEYEETTTLINQKDTAYDKVLSKLESERNALTTEIDALENIIDANVEKHFKLYS